MMVHALRLFGLIASVVPIGQHALMKDAGNQNAAALLAIKHNMHAMLQAAQARANFLARSAQRGIVGEGSAKNFEFGEIAGGLDFAPSAKRVVADAEQVSLRATRETNRSHS